MQKSLTILLLFSYCLCLKAEEYTDRSFIDKLDLISDKEDQTSKALFAITKKMHQFLSLKFSKLPGTAPKVTLKIEGTPPSTDTFRIIYFKRNDLNKMNSMEIIHRITKQLLHRILVSYDAPANVHVPDWLTAGYVYQYIVGDTLSSLEKYPVSRLSIINKKYPDIDILLKENGPDPAHYWLYSVYAERSAVFLRGVVPLSRGKKSLFAYLIKPQGRDVIDYLSTKYEDLKTQRLRNNWFKKACQRVCFDVINPYPPAEIREKVNHLLSVTVARPGNNGLGTMRKPLEELTDDTTQAVDLNYIALLERSLLEISLTSSETVRPALLNFITSLQLLKRKEYDDFKESMIKAKKTFHEAIVRQEKLNVYLDELEKKHNQLASDYSRIILADEIAEIRKRETFPALSLYLDELEKKLANIVIE